VDEALEAAVKLADRYIAGRFLPDKAIDLIDEAGSRARLSVLTVPPDIKNLEEKIEKIRKEKESAIKGQDFELAASLRDQEREAKESLEKMKGEWKKTKGEAMPVITGEDISVIVSKWTGIPLIRLEERETERLLKMEEAVHKRIVGQEPAITAIARAVRRSRSGLKDPRRPIGSFVFLGPTGVGKTLLARALAEFMFGDEEALIQLDMSEYMEKFNISRLVGAPPGYVGYEEGGQLTERVRRRPYSVVLLDEIEKAHPDVFNILLQVLEDGRLTDSFGRKVDFRNTILIMTSNIGADLIKKQGGLGFASTTADASFEKMRTALLEEVKHTFKPEFLNRIDDVIVFNPLTRENLIQIVELEIHAVQDRLREQGIQIELDDSAKEFLVEKGFDPIYGARPLRRIIQRFLEDPLAEEVIAHRVKSGTSLRATRKGEALHFEDQMPAEQRPSTTS